MDHGKVVTRTSLAVDLLFEWPNGAVCVFFSAKSANAC
jgi:hypothetical protein